MKLKVRSRHPLEWLLEPLEDEPGYLRKKMFGCEAAYMNGRLTVVLASGGEPWTLHKQSRTLCIETGKPRVP